MNVAFIGYRGTGKSCVARLLALRLGWPWIDADVELEFRAGKSIAQIFADEGEGAFRDLESQVIADLVRRPSTVIATGGGVVMREENRQALRSAGGVIWLKASPPTIYRRMAADASTMQRRPPLTAFGGLDEIVQLLARREPLYRQCADLEIDTEDKDPQAVAEEAFAWLQTRMSGSTRGTQ